MRNAVIISIVFHLGVIMVTVVGLPSLRDEVKTEMTVIPVEMVKVGEQTRLKPKPVKVDKVEDKPEEAPKQPERKTAPKPPPPPKMASSMPLPDVKPKPKPQKSKPDPEPQVAASRAPDVAPRAKPQPPSRFSSSRIAALLDKRQEERKTLGEMLKDKGYDQPAAPSDLDLQQQTLSLADAIRQQVHGCWSIPAGAKEAENLQVTIRINLTPDGRLARAPRVKDQNRMTQPGQEFFRTAAESALRAVRKCVPYELPREKYELWREIELIFDPKEVLAG